MENRILGEIDIMEEEIIYFPNGIIGFEGYKRFVIMPDKNHSPFCWLISLDEEDFGVPLVNPYSLIKEFQKDFPLELTNELKDSNSKFEVFCVVNLKGSDGSATLNLKGPILIDFINKVGKQIILTADILSITYPLN
jgi:flagellar assembly factor FliW